eukprot:m51a1_g4221 putative camp phosphodiesterase (915) ;mRNA; r:90547-94889
MFLVSGVRVSSVAEPGAEEGTPDETISVSALELELAQMDTAVAFLLLSAATATALGACQTVTPLRVQLHWLVQAQCVGFLAANTFGYFADECLNVTIAAGGPGLDWAAEVSSGRAEIATAWVSDVFTAYDGGTVDLAVIANIMRGSASVVASLASSGPRTAADLAGKRVSALSTQRPQIEAMAAAAGVAPSLLTFPEWSYGVDGLISGSYDALGGVTYNELGMLYRTKKTVSALYEKTDFNLMYPSDYNVTMLEDAVVVRKSWLAANASIATRFLRAATRGWIRCVSGTGAPACAKLLSLQSTPGMAWWTVNELNRVLWADTGHPFGVARASAWQKTIEVYRAVATNASNATALGAILDLDVQNAVATQLAQEGLDVYGITYEYIPLDFCLSGANVVLCQELKDRGRSWTLTIALAVAIPVAFLLLAGTLWLLRNMYKLRFKVSRLESQLDMVISGKALGTPVEFAIRVLQDISTRRGLKKDDRSDLAKIISLLSSNSMYKAEEIVKKQLGNLNFEPTVGAYIEETLFQPSNSGRSRGGDGLVERASGEMRIPDITVPAPLSMSPLGDIQMTVERWDFKVTDLAGDPTLTKSPLEIVVMSFIELLELTDLVDMHKYSALIHDIVSGYNEGVPYHNSMHAADVAQAVGSILCSVRDRCPFTKLEQLAALTAAAAHDYGHCGLNNNFLCSSRDPLALRYNFISVRELPQLLVLLLTSPVALVVQPLENMHASEMVSRIFRDGSCFMDLPRSDVMDLANVVIQIILSTDMVRHVEIMGQFSAKIASSTLDLKSRSNRSLLLQIITKFADISNCSREWETCFMWSMRVQQEFFAQGDRETMLGLEVSPFMDRRSTDWPMCQSAFISFVMTPLVDALAKTVGTDNPVIIEAQHNMMTNIDQWRKQETAPTSAPLFPNTE